MSSVEPFRHGAPVFETMLFLITHSRKESLKLSDKVLEKRTPSKIPLAPVYILDHTLQMN